MYSDWGIGLERKSDEMGNCGATGFRIFMWDDGDVYSEQLATTAPISPCHGAIPSAATAVNASMSGTLPI